MFYDPRSEPHGLAHNPWTALVVPRPIGWISSLSVDGVANLAPYSYYNAVSGLPPFVMFSSAGRKDSQTNIEATGEFVVNMATAELREQVNLSSAMVAPAVDEFEMTGLAKAPGRVRTDALVRMAAALEIHRDRIVAANALLLRRLRLPAQTAPTAPTPAASRPTSR